MLLNKYPLLLSFFLIPALLILWHLQTRFEKIALLETKIESLGKNKTMLSQNFQAHSSVFNQLKERPTLSVQKELSSLSFLNAESKKLQIVLDHYKESPSHQLRLNFLKSGKNRLSFKEEKRETNTQFQEVFLALAHPLEQDEDDLKNMLLLIENSKNPQLFFQKFSLFKKKIDTQNEVFEIDFKLIKRELL